MLTSSIHPTHLRLTLVALAVLALAGVARAEPLPAVEGTVTVGLGGLTGDGTGRTLFGQYYGLQPDRKAFGMLGVDYTLRNEEEDIVLLFQGTRVFGETREMSLVRKKQGDWKFSANYGELVWRAPYDVKTGLLGAGSTAPQVAVLAGGPGTGADLDLKIKRTGLGVGFATWINLDTLVEIDLKTEGKEGARLFGIGMTCPSLVAPGCRGSTGINTGWAVLMLPEPIQSRHSQVEARLSYSAQSLRVSAGYYGSFYTNTYGAMTPGIPGSLNNPLGSLLPLNTGLQSILSQPVALPPDSQAHQLDLSGTYDFSRTTRASFKLGYAQATQHEDFARAGLAGAPAGVTNLGGKVNTKLAQVGVTSRPIPKLSLLADLRYEDKDDRTPIALYNIVDTSTFTNHRLPSTKVRGRVEAAYQFVADYRGSLGVDYESIDRGVFTATSAVSGISALRQKTDETGVRAELRRRMSEDFSGALTVARSQRNGSNWLKPNSGLGVSEITDPNNPATGFLPTAVFMPTLADRQRDKLKLSGDWQPTEALAVQLVAEEGKDRFSAPTAYGLHRTRMSQLSLDWTFALTDIWSLNGYASQARQAMHQSRPAGYVMAFDNTNLGFGLGFAGRAFSKLELGGNLSIVADTSVYAQTLDAFAGADSAALLAATGGLPDIVVHQTTAMLFGKYALDKRSAVRIDVAYRRETQNDWTWGYNGVPFSYSDGTTVWQRPKQNVGFLGISYVHQWN